MTAEHYLICHAYAVGDEPALLCFKPQPAELTAQLVESFQFMLGGMLPAGSRQYMVASQVLVVIPAQSNYEGYLHNIAFTLRQGTGYEMLRGFLARVQYLDVMGQLGF